MNWLKENWFKLGTLGGLFISFLFFWVISPSPANSYGECDQYGIFAMYDILSDSCKCMSGYVFDKDIFGNTTCKSGNSVCTEKYGYGAEYDSLSKSCECSYGYVFADKYGQTQCVSRDQACRDQLGYNSKYNTLHNKCECSYGYVIDGGKCTDADTVCRNKHGYHSNYDSLDNSCECDSGYTFDDANQCVEKQNNVYFLLKELDTNEKRAIIKSDYDYRYYLINYGIGCYPSSFKRYLNGRIVVNLGTDFYVDTWDKIVLQNESEVCDITRVERAYSDTTLYPEEEDIFFIPNPVPIPTPTVPKVNPPTSVPKTIEPIESKKIQSIIQKASSSSAEISTTSVVNETDIKAESSNSGTLNERWYKRFFKKFFWFFY